MIQDPNWRIARCRGGLSLLEVLLSIAILGGSLLVIGNLVGHGYRAATEARLRSEATILCDTKMAEISAGVLDLESVSDVAIEENQEWEYSVDVEPSNQTGLLIATVTVRQSPAVAANPLSLSLVRFIPDPDYDPTADDDPNATIP